MKQKAAAVIVRFRILWIVILTFLCISCLFTVGKTRINYDLTSYLAEDTDTKRGLNLMQGEFDQTSFMSVVLTDAEEKDVRESADRIGRISGVVTAAYDPAEGTREHNGHVYRLISVTVNADQEEQTLDAVEEMLSGTPHMISSNARDSRELQQSILREMPLVMLVSCAIVLLILLLMTTSWVEPVLFFAVIGVSILLNMGTNWIFPSISFVTFAVTAILQLALAMDYSIMLMNAFDRLRKDGLPVRDAMTQALSDAFMPIASSSLTTVAGMLALVFMKFTIGFDIGIVLAKGILISMLTVFFLMPGLLIAMAPLLDKTFHRPLQLTGRLINGLSGHRSGLLPVFLILLIIAGAFLQGQSTYTYTMRDISKDSRTVSELFGQSNQIVLLFPRDSSDEGITRQRQLAERISAIEADGLPVVKQLLSMVTTAEAAVTYYDAAEAAKLLGRDEKDVKQIFSLLHVQTPIRGDVLIKRLSVSLRNIAFILPDGMLQQLEQTQQLLETAETVFNGRQYSRAVVTLDLPYHSPYAHKIVSSMKSILHDLYGEDCAMTGMLLAMDDIATSFKGDMHRVTLITDGLVFLIIVLSFSSIWIPLLLVSVIQGAIWINMSFSNLYDGSIFFMCYLICVALQMGATIDYGILLTSHYRNLRKKMSPPDAARQAIGLSLQTVMTSGMALVTAGFSVGIVSSVFYISSIGTMLGRGAIVSVSLVLLLLPKLLQWLDKKIV